MDLFDQIERPRKFEKYQLRGGEVWLMTNFMPIDLSFVYYNKLSSSIDWRQEKMKMFGKTFPVPRLTAWYGYPDMNYTYSGIDCNPSPWTQELMDIKSVIEHFVPNETFNSVLLNLYRDGNDKVGWHADDERELGKHPTIASVSLGATRRFDLKHKDYPDEKLQVNLTSGSLVIMTGELQSHWLHQIPMQKTIREPRINLTFRNIQPDANIR